MFAPQVEVHRRFGGTHQRAHEHAGPDIFLELLSALHIQVCMHICVLHVLDAGSARSGNQEVLQQHA